MTHLICYDISKDKLRKKVSDRLMADGLYRVQYSVFVGPISPSLLDRFKEWVKVNILTDKDSNDSIIILPLHEINVRKMCILGKDILDREELLGQKLALFL